ncbi:hypothetical protein H5410_056563 [Solanum commersonii]|uniref:Uncharacterized protein n=1 Tax=Solanum commersonii TaxID=4109 RepID=A0A9J5WM33_SOLCO|nr:hypothetical protein H5410_056563 [Solanum commersonii]
MTSEIWITKRSMDYSTRKSTKRGVYPLREVLPVAACNKLLVWVFRCFPSSPSSSGIFKSSDGLSSAYLLSCC